MSKSRFLSSFVVFLLLIAVVGCNRDSKPESRKSGDEPSQVTLVARCKANPPTEEGRCNNLIAAAEAVNAELASRGDKRHIHIEIIQDDKNWANYKTEFELASDAGEAPDIIVSGHEHIGDWAPAGLIIPLTDMLGKSVEFNDVIDSLWRATEWNGERWGVPQDAEVRPFYYSKLLLRKLGWTDGQIESLPNRIKNGEFTWEDMLDTAEQAVQASVVKPGNGWWHRPRNGPDFLYYYFAQGGEIVNNGDALLFDKKAVLKVYQLLYSASQERRVLSKRILGMQPNEWDTAVSSADKILFWFAGSWDWGNWSYNYLRDRGGENYLFKNVGFALIPAGRTGVPITLTHPLVYMISSRCKYPDLALLVIAKATTKELNTPYAVESGHLGILKSQAEYPPYTSAKFLNKMLPLLDFTTFLPNSPYWSTWSEAFFLGIRAVESGDLKPEDALEVVVDRLENELGEHVVIR
ncbi:extracellular solute-binding protein [Candidatus Poribacteria bacterium]|nr:extracellular solute-binding protein [Candidatus Poribacteria bacterium]